MKGEGDDKLYKLLEYHNFYNESAPTFKVKRYIPGALYGWSLENCEGTLVLPPINFDLVIAITFLAITFITITTLLL